MIRIARFAAAALVLGLGTCATAAAAPSETVRWFGDSSSATGAALGQGACDLNADGFDDAVVGAWFWDKAPNNNVGAAYVLFGGADVAGGDLNTPAGAGAARIDGPAVANSFVGFSVVCVGDVNGDAIDDLAIGHYTEEKAYVVLGAERFGSIDLGQLGDRGFEIHGSTDPAYDYNVGFSMAPAGDVDGDGLDDVAIAGVVADTQGRTNNGRVWVVAGQRDVADVDLIDPAAGAVLQTIDGAGSDDRLGAIAPAGDVNGDGTDDLVLGAYTSTPWGTSVAAPGAAWVVWGGETGAVDLATVGDRGFAIYGPKRGRDRLGVSVAGAGDVDGDGLDDVLIGGDGVYNAATGERPGSAWVVFGRDSGDRVYTETDPAAAAAVYSCAGDGGSGTCAPGDTSARGYWIAGADSNPGTGSESTGYSLSGIGDVSGDGRPDFAIGAYGYDPADPANPGSRLTGAGAVWVVHGKPSTATQELSGVSAAEGYRIDGLVAGDRFGRQVAGLGDLDGNGRADFAAGADFAQRPLAGEAPRAQAGEVAVALSGPLVTETTLAGEPDGPLAPGDAVDLSASVATLAGGGGPAGAGAVTFTRGGAPVPGCSSVAVDPADGTASCTPPRFEHRGSFELGATYVGTDAYAASEAAPVTLLVREPSVVGLESSADPASAGELVILTAPVRGAATGAAADAGAVEFRAAGAPIPGCEAVAVGHGGATCATAFAAAGTLQLTATYSAVPELGPSTSAALAQRVVAAPPSARRRGTRGEDRLIGTGADDEIDGRRGDDTIKGKGGDDTLKGGPGRDRVSGGAGDDEISGGPGRDVLRCGGGDDRADADRRDKVASNCERVV